jgi:outer membrane protein assembly factor BamB
MLVLVSNNGTIQAIDPANGTVKWRREIAEGFVAGPAFAADRVVVATPGKQVFIVLLSNGQIDSFRSVQYNVTALAASGTYVVVGDEHGNVSVFDGGAEKPRWRFRSGGQISSIVPIGDHVVAASNDNFVYLLGLSRGGLDWKRRLTGRPTQASSYWGRYVLVSASDSHSALLLDMTNGKVAGQAAFGPDEDLIASTTAVTGPVIVGTNEAIHQYMPGGCPMTKNDGPGQSPGTAALK